MRVFIVFAISFKRSPKRQLSGVDISLISNQLQSVSGEKIVLPSRATALGLAKAIAKEYPAITCRSIDCDPAGQGMSYVAVQIIAELCASSDDKVIAYRGNRRWIERFEALGCTWSYGRPETKRRICALGRVWRI